MSVGDTKAASAAAWVTILLSFGGWAYQLGYQSSRIDTLQTQVTRISDGGSEIARRADQTAKATHEAMLREFSRFDAKLDAIEKKIDAHMTGGKP